MHGEYHVQGALPGYADGACDSSDQDISYYLDSNG
jgi:hypothetical protein